MIQFYSVIQSISENVTWGQRKRFADGKVSMAYKQFLGYRKGPDGLPEIDPEQAEVVRKIYRLFMAGKTIGYICKLLEAEGIPTPGGKTKWQSQTVNSILTNEKLGIKIKTTIRALTKLMIYLTCREEVKKIYERIQIFDASSSETNAEEE